MSVVFAYRHKQPTPRPLRSAVPGFRSILVPVNTLQPELPADMIDIAARLAAERRASIVLLAFSEIALGDEMDVDLPDGDERVAAMASEARALAGRYGVGVHVVARRCRRPDELILAEAGRTRADLIMLVATGTSRANYRSFARDQTTRRLAREAGTMTMFVQPPKESWA